MDLLRLTQESFLRFFNLPVVTLHRHDLIIESFVFGGECFDFIIEHTDIVGESFDFAISISQFFLELFLSHLA